MARLFVSGALAVVACLLVAGCGSGGEARKAPTPHAAKECRLTVAQKRAVARAQADIRRLRRIQAPLHTFSQRGTPAQERVTGQFLADLTRVRLPIDTRAKLIEQLLSEKDFATHRAAVLSNSLLPEKYRDPDLSQLACEVKGKTNNIDFDLE